MKALGVGLCVLITFSVASFGAVEVWSESVVEIGTAVLLVLWACLALLKPTVEVRWNPLNWPILGFCAVGAVQLLFHATAYPFLTRTELLRAVTCWAFFFLAAQAFQNRADFYGLAWFLILLSFAASLLGIIQYFTSNDRIYWVQQITAGVKPFGPFVNRNHFAGFVELTLPTGLALLMLRGIRREQVPLMILLTLVPISAVVLASSRAGIICVGLEVCGLAAFRLGRKRAERVRVAPVVVAVAAGVILIGWIGVGHAVERFLPSYNTSMSMGKRVSMTRGALRIFLAHPVSGAGLGTTIAVYPPYETMYDGKVVDHVHDDYAEALAETGLLGGACGVFFLILLFWGVARRLTTEQGHFSHALHAGAIAAAGGLLLHSFVDFNLHILSNALLFLLQTFVATAPAFPANKTFRSRIDARPRIAVQMPSA
ncbi:MAG TPA: O-antigen ligase family protein [Candidatus Acidoferrales bacterium]|nr:O-antigen ligase family protein [Candidatus Acidoferrales bacterium]